MIVVDWAVFAEQIRSISLFFAECLRLLNQMVSGIIKEE
jgi:hypothetical protein